MAIIPTYEQQVLPQGQVQSQATPNDFGAQVGAGMMTMGAGLTEAADAIHRVQEDQGRIWAYDAASRTYTSLKQDLGQRVNALDPNDPDFAEKTGRLTEDFNQRIEEQHNDLIDQAPTRSARHLLSAHLASNGRALLNAAMQEQARITGEYTGKLVNDGIKADQDAVAADPSNDNFNRIMENRTGSIGGLAGVDPVSKIKWQADMEHGLAVTQVQVLAASNPQLFLATVHAQGGQIATGKGAVPGGPDGMPQVQPLTDQEIGEAAPAIAGWGKLSWQEKVAAVRQAEGAMGGNLAAERGAMAKDLRDVEASLMAGKSYPGLEAPRFSLDNLLKLYGPVEGQRQFDQLTYVKKVGGLISEMARMPSTQAMATFKALEPQGGPEFADKAPTYHQALEAFQRVQELRNKDYMSWAQGAGVGDVKPIDFSSPDAFHRTVNDRVPAAVAGWVDYRADSHVFTKDEAARFSDMMTRLNSRDQMLYLKALRGATDDRWFRDSLAMIAPQNTTLAYAAGVSGFPGTVSTAAGPQNGETVAQYILEGIHILQGKDIDNPQHTGRPLVFDEAKIRQAFWDVVGLDAFSGPDPQRNHQIASDTYQAVKNYLASDYYRRGLNLKDFDDKEKCKAFVHNAVGAVTGGVVAMPQGDHLFLPWGMSHQDFEPRFQSALDVALRNSGLKGTAMDLPDAYHYRNVGDGRYLVTNGSKPLVGRDGRSVVVDVYKPAPLATIKEIP